MKKFILSTAILFSPSALADCWNQCLASVNGNCLAKTKVCNVSDAENAIEHLGKDITAAYENIRNEWVDLYGRMPEDFQEVLNKYPLTFATLVIPGTREYTMLSLALEEFVHKTKARARAVKDLIDQSPDWKKSLLKDGEVIILMLEKINLANHDYSKPFSPSDKYEVVFSEFLDCIELASTHGQGLRCLDTLKKKAVVL